MIDENNISLIRSKPGFGFFQDWYFQELLSLHSLSFSSSCNPFKLTIFKFINFVAYEKSDKSQTFEIFPSI